MTTDPQWLRDLVAPAPISSYSSDRVSPMSERRHVLAIVAGVEDKSAAVGACRAIEHPTHEADELRPGRS